MCSLLGARTFIDLHERTSNWFLIEPSKGPAPREGYSRAEAFLRGRNPFHISYGEEWCVWGWSRPAGLSKDLRKALAVVQIYWLDPGGNRIKHPWAVQIPVMGDPLERESYPRDSGATEPVYTKRATGFNSCNNRNAYFQHFLFTLINLYFTVEEHLSRDPSPFPNHDTSRYFLSHCKRTFRYSSGIQASTFQLAQSDKEIQSCSESIQQQDLMANRLLAGVGESQRRVLQLLVVPTPCFCAVGKICFQNCSEREHLTEEKTAKTVGRGTYSAYSQYHLNPWENTFPVETLQVAPTAESISCLYRASTVCTFWNRLSRLRAKTDKDKKQYYVIIRPLHILQPSQTHAHRYMVFICCIPVSHSNIIRVTLYIHLSMFLAQHLEHLIIPKRDILAPCSFIR